MRRRRLKPGLQQGIQATQKPLLSCSANVTYLKTKKSQPGSVERDCVHYRKDAAIAFDKWTSRHGARERMAVVKSKQKPSRRRSIQAIVPVAPV